MICTRTHATLAEVGVGGLLTLVVLVSPEVPVDLHVLLELGGVGGELVPPALGGLSLDEADLNATVLDGERGGGSIDLVLEGELELELLALLVGGEGEGGLGEIELGGLGGGDLDGDPELGGVLSPAERRNSTVVEINRRMSPVAVV